MGHSDYPLQALLYAAVLHRFLRWRQPGYDPEQHLGGVLYLYLRGMCGPDDAAGRRGAVRGLRLAAAGRAGRGAVRPARRRGPGGATDERAVRAGRRARLAADPRGAPGCWRRSTAGPAQRRPTSTSPPGSATSAARPTTGCCWRSPSRCAPCAAARSASTSPPSPSRRPSCRGPTPTRGGRRCAASPLVEAGVVRWDHDLLYLDRYHRLEAQVCDDLRARDRPRRRRRSTRPGWTPRLDLLRGDALQRRAASCRGDERRAAPDDDPHRRPRHRQDHHRRPAAGAAGRPGRGTGRAALDRAGRADRQGRDPAEEAVEAGLAEVAEASPQARAAAERVGHPRGGDPAPAARLAARQQHPVPSRPQQPAQVRRGRRRRVLDGRADHDGPAARGAAAAGPAGAGRRPRAAHLGRRRRGAQRPGRRLRPAPDSPVAAAHRELPQPPRTSRRSPRRSATGDADGVLDVLRGRRPTRSSSSRSPTRPRPRPRCAPDCERRRSPRARGRARRGRRGRGRRARRAPSAVRPPRGSGRRTPLEPAGRALARRASPASTLYDRVVRRPPAAGHQQRLRARRLQRRDRRRGPQGQRRRALRSRAPTGSRRLAPGRLDAVETMHATDHPQEPGQPGRAGHGAAAGRRLPAAHPRALLHRGHPGPGARPGRRHRGRGPARRRHQGPASDPASRSGSPVRPHPEPPETRAVTGIA